MKNKIIHHLPVLLLIILGMTSRFIGINWDQGYHLHPDERAIILFTLPLSPPSSISDFFSVESSWNPNFFAYGSLPLYLLYSISSLLGHFFPWLATYDGLLYVGRSISAIADIVIIVLLFVLGKKYFSRTTGLFAATFYLMSTFALQAAHFYAVDTLLTLFCLLSLYCLLEYVKTQSTRKLIGFAVFFGFALATKISSLLLFIPYLLTICYHFHSHWQSQSENRRIIKNVRFLVKTIALSLPITLLVFFLCMPYAFIDFSEFYRQINEQSAMTKNAWTFPYTLQYVGKIPYIYELSQIFFWGQGPLLAVLTIGGTVYVTMFLFSHPQKKHLGILLSFFWVYFLVVGNFSIGFMRYMLPLYPLICIFGAIWGVQLIHFFSTSIRRVIIPLYFILIVLLPLSFLQIYLKPNTKVAASHYIISTIPAGSNVAVEHWDDQLPLVKAEEYQTETLELYLEDTPQKWNTINKQLAKTEYLILASNRLYTPLSKLTNCQKLHPHPCYKQTAEYYKELFAGEKGFEKIAEFSSYPTIPVVNIPLYDQSADESFTVYDHSKVIIFKKKQ